MLAGFSCLTTLSNLSCEDIVTTPELSDLSQQVHISLLTSALTLSSPLILFLSNYSVSHSLDYHYYSLKSQADLHCNVLSFTILLQTDYQ